MGVLQSSRCDCKMTGNLPVGCRVSRRGYMMKAKAAKKAMKGKMQA